MRSPLHLAPEIEPSGASAGPVEIRPLGDGLDVAHKEGRYAPYIGTFQRTVVIEQTGDVEPEVPFGWSLLRPEADARLEGDVLTLTCPDEATRTVALRWDLP